MKIKQPSSIRAAPSAVCPLPRSRDAITTNENDHGIRFGRIAAMLPVRDIDKAEAFYTRILGFRKVFENGDPVGFMILERDDAELHPTLQKSHVAAPFNVAHLMVDDVDALHAICQGEGLRIIKGLRDHDFGLRAFVFADPDGNRIDVGARLRQE